MARKKTTPEPIDLAELEAEVSRAIAADPDAGQQLQGALAADEGAARGEAPGLSTFLGRFLEAYALLKKIGVIEWIEKRRAGQA